MQFDLGLFLAALTTAAMLQGAALALALSVVVFALSFLGCLPLALLLNSPGKARALSAHLYTWVFRAAPLILVLLLVWNGAPQIMPVLLKASWFNPFVAAAIAFTLVTIAYMGEIMKGALLAVGSGQVEAARALGLTPLQTFVLVTLPQALRIALPPLVNEFINLLKVTSLAYIISLREIMAVVNDAIAASFRFVEWYLAALLYYLVIVSLFMMAQAFIQKRLR
jgi:polar amino acid transport system permease protein